jgi:RHS repeat-associated protein
MVTKYDNLWNRTSQENYTLKEIQSETCTDETIVEDVTLPNGKTKTVERKVINCTIAVTQVEKEKNTLVYNSNSLNQYTKLQNLNKNWEVKKEFTYEYDNNGNLVKDDINRYIYDYKNRLIQVLQNEVIKVDESWNIIEIIPEVEIVSFEYDILNRRIEKKTEDKTINYIYAGQNAIKEIITDNTTNQVIETRQNIYSNNLDDILSVIITDEINQTTNQYFYEKNHLWSISKITDAQWSIVEQYEYDVFWVAYASINNVEAVTTAQNNKTLNIKKAEWSETANDWNTDELVIDSIRYKRYNGKGKIWNTRLYIGREYDAELKLYYNRARYYSPDLGRFISRNLIDVSDDVNLYGYVGNNGVNIFYTKKIETKIYLFLFTHFIAQSHQKKNYFKLFFNKKLLSALLFKL